jgi:hypothetical protein
MKEKIELVGSVEIAEDVMNKVKTVGVRGLDFDKARELGVFKRIGNLLTACHATVLAAYSIYGHVDYLMDELQGRRNEIAREMNMFDKSFERFIKFWTSYYTKGCCEEEVMHEMENLYHRIMNWAELPEEWQLGDKQRIDIDAGGSAIRIKSESDTNVTVFREASLNHETIESSEKWGVLRYDPKKEIQKTVHVDMDKASALMTAKRMSADEPNDIFTAAIIRDITERRTDVIPFKAFRNNETVGKLIRTERDNG